MQGYRGHHVLVAAIAQMCSIPWFTGVIGALRGQTGLLTFSQLLADPQAIPLLAHHWQSLIACQSM
jgi:hypothetical protein